jgi:putative ABC transport system substrate-binding protein
LVRHKVALIVTSTSASALAAKAAAVSIPIVFEIGGDPVKLGLVKSLNRPGGNLTGLTQLTGDLEAKRLELLREAVPNARVIGVLVNRNRSGVEDQLRDVQGGGSRDGATTGCPRRSKRT